MEGVGRVLRSAARASNSRSMDVEDIGIGKAAGDANGDMKIEVEVPEEIPGPSSGRDGCWVGTSSRPSKTRKRSAASGQGRSKISKWMEPRLTLTDSEEDDEDLEAPVEEDIDEIEEMDEIPQFKDVAACSSDERLEISENFKRIGNDLSESGEHNGAIEMYNRALGYTPTEGSLYECRSDCNFKLKKFQEAIFDTRRALNLRPNNGKNHLRLVRATLALGDVLACREALQIVVERGGFRIFRFDFAEEKRQLELLKEYLAEIECSKLQKDYPKILFLSTRAIVIAFGDSRLKILKADALIQLGRFAEAEEICTEILEAGEQNEEAAYILGKCMYQADDLDKSVEFLLKGADFAPHREFCIELYRKIHELRTLRTSASSLYLSGEYVNAKSIYTDCEKVVTSGDMKNITIESKIAFNMGLLSAKLGELDDSIRYLNRAIELNPSYFKAVLHRANVHTSKEMHNEAVRDLETAFKLNPTHTDLKTMIENAKMAATRVKKMTFYQILHVDRHASIASIRKAYKRQALLHHPDRHASESIGVQKDQEQKFKDVFAAYETLSDSTKRYIYDQDQEILQNQSGGGSATSKRSDETDNSRNVYFRSYNFARHSGCT